jgi:signal transduction histidine kinase
MTKDSLKVEQSQTVDSKDFQRELQLFRKVQDITLELAMVSDLQPLMEAIVDSVTDSDQSKRAALLVMDNAGSELQIGHIKPQSRIDKDKLSQATINTYNAENDPVVGQWIKGISYQHTDTSNIPESRAKTLFTFLEMDKFYSFPLKVKEKLVGILIIEPLSDKLPSTLDQQMFNSIAANSAVILYNTRLHIKTVEQLAANMKEMSLLGQIDRELNETIALPTVFNMMLDWALRFTNANVATIALYDEETDTLRTQLNYGYSISDEELARLRGQNSDTISHRVARSGRIEVVPDVSMDANYVFVTEDAKSQMAIPVLREEKVIAVITLESKKLNAFTDPHVDFVQNLANRAAVAIDNARLYTETEREREKLSHIVGNIADVVIVIGTDNKILLISQSAISALSLYADRVYVGQTFEADAIGFTPLVDMYRRACAIEEEADEELTLPNGRTYFTRTTPQRGAGWIIVMQDITPFKEMDRLKSELIATVSHDLKQPLGVMRGYPDLLQMKNTFDESSTNFVNMIDRAINNMRQLIDDLLDLARIESGMELEFETIPLRSVLNECIDNMAPSAKQKAMTLIAEIPDDTPAISGERSRLHQIFSNLISNAIKYTPPEGEVKVTAEQRGLIVRIAIQDNGLGISPEDLPHIFDRFYRVRRAETESIDGTGLGLAIVKTLIEAHHGKIRVESKLGEGSTFFVTLPIEERKN